MLLLDILRRSLRSLRAAKARTLLTALAIAVGTFALTLTLGASNGAQGYVNKIIDDNFDPSALLVTKDKDLFGRSDSSQPQEYNPSFGSVLSATGVSTQVSQLDDSDISRLRSVPGVQQVQTATSVAAQYVTRPGLRKYVATLTALGPSQHPLLLAGAVDQPLTDKQVILPQAFLSELGFKSAKQAIGKQLTVSVQQQVNATSALSALAAGNTSALNGNTAASKTESFTIVAVAKKPTAIISATALYLYVNANATAALNDYQTIGTAGYHKYLTASVIVRGGATNNAALKRVQQRIKTMGYGAQSVEDTQKFLSQIITVLQGIVTAFGFIAVVASLFGIINTMYISVLQRTREIGLMKALGMRRKDVSRLFRFEAALLGFIGGLLGAVAAVALGTALNPVIATRLGLGSQHLLVFQLKQIVVLILLLIVVATIAGLLPARKAARLNPIDALRAE